MQPSRRVPFFASSSRDVAVFKPNDNRALVRLLTIRGYRQCILSACG